MQQVAAPLARLPDDPMALAADARFPQVLRGYDCAAVNAYVRSASQLVVELHAHALARDRGATATRVEDVPDEEL